MANHIYNFLKREYMERFYLAVSRKFDGCESLPSVLEQLEQQMEEKFYHPDKHVFTNEDEVLGMAVGEVQDSQLMQAISEDITRKDIEQLWRHFECLKEKYHDNTQYSAMYIKFVFFRKTSFPVSTNWNTRSNASITAGILWRSFL